MYETPTFGSGQSSLPTFSRNMSSDNNRVANSMYQMASNSGSMTGSREISPITDDFHIRTEAVTKRLKELILAMQDENRRDGFVFCAEKVKSAVLELTGMFPPVSKYKKTKKKRFLRNRIFYIAISE